MPLQIRRGTQSEVDQIIPLEGEPIFVTDQDKLVIGDGTTQGGINITANLQDLRVSSSGVTTSLYDADSTGTIQLINGTNDNKIALNSTGTTITGPLFIGNTATVNAIRFSDGTVQTTADTANPDQSVNTTSNVRFAGLTVTGYSTLTNATVTNILEVATIRFADGSTQTTADTANPNQALNTTSDVTFNSVQIGGNSGNKIRLANNAVYVDSTTSVVVTAPNGFAIDGSAPGNATISVDQIQGRVAGGVVDFTTAAEFSTTATFKGRALFIGTDTNISGNYIDIAEPVGRLRVNSNEAVELNGQGVIVPTGVLYVDEINAWDSPTGVGFLTTASFTDIVIGTEKVNQTDYQTVNFPNNVNVSNVLVLGSGSAPGYLTSKGNNVLEIGTSDNDGPGPKIVIGTGDGSTIQFKDFAERAIAEFSTSTITFSQPIEQLGTVYFGGSGGGNVATINTLPNGGATLAVTNTSTLGFMNIGPLNSQFSIPGVTAAATAMLFDQGVVNNSQIWFRTRAGANNNIMAWDQNNGLRFTRGQRLLPSPTNGAVILADGTSTTTSLYGGVALSSGAAGSTATTVNVNRFGFQTLYRSQTGTSRIILQEVTDGTWTNRMTVVGLAGPWLTPFEQNTNTTIVRAYDVASTTTMSTLTFTNNLLSMTDSTNANVFEFSNTTATFYEPVVATTATVNYMNIANWAVFTAVTADPGGTTASGTVLMADGTQWDPAGFSTTTNYMAFYNGGSWVALG